MRLMTEGIRTARGIRSAGWVLLALGGLSLATVSPGLTAGVTPAVRTAVIESLAEQMNGNYVFPELATDMMNSVREKARGGAYDDLIDGRDFAERLTHDLREVSNDLHLTVQFRPGHQVSEESHDDEGSPPESWIAGQRRSNWGFEKVERLKGNVGYLDLRMFAPTAMAAETAIGAMNFLANSDALIIDLRQNGGGDPDMVQLLTSYLYGPHESVHLNSLYFRPADLTHQFWTLPFVPGKRMPDVDLYVLTSSFTGSAAEEFAYNIRNLERGTLVGETTAGAAHPGGEFRLTDDFTAFIATGRAINPVSGTDWEGVGVLPHIAVSAEDALTEAHTLALKGLLDKAEDPDRKRAVEWDLMLLQAETDPFFLDQSEFARFAGKYGIRQVRIKDNNLVYQRESGPSLPLQALSPLTFKFRDMDDYKFEFDESPDGLITAFTATMRAGRSFRAERDE